MHACTKRCRLPNHGRVPIQKSNDHPRVDQNEHQMIHKLNPDKTHPMTLIESSNEFKQFESKHLRNIVKERYPNNTEMQRAAMSSMHSVGISFPTCTAENTLKHLQIRSFLNTFFSWWA